MLSDILSVKLTDIQASLLKDVVTMISYILLLLRWDKGKFRHWLGGLVPFKGGLRCKGFALISS